MKKQAGFTMFEIMIAAGSVALIAYSYMTVMDIRRQSLLRVHFSYSLSDLVVANVNEVKAKAFNLLPTADNCLVRYYKLDQSERANFDSEFTVVKTNAACGGDAPVPRRVDIFWKSRGTVDVQNDVTFNPSVFLKLPTIRGSVVEIEVKGRMLTLGSSPTEQTFGTIIYRK